MFEHLLCLAKGLPGANRETDRDRRKSKLLRAQLAKELLFVDVRTFCLGEEVWSELGGLRLTGKVVV